MTEPLPVLKTTNAVGSALVEAEWRRLAAQPVRAASPTELVFHAWMMDWSTPDDLENARALCEKAEHLDPALAAPLWCQATVISAELDHGPNPLHAQLKKQADDFSRRAVELSENNAAVWVVRAQALRWQFQWEAAHEALSRAIQLDPSSMNALVMNALLSIWTGRPEEAFPLLARAADIAPSAVGEIQRRACRAYLALGRYDEAVVSCERAASVDGHWALQTFLAVAYAQKGDAEKAAAARSRALMRKPEVTLAWFKAYAMQTSDNRQYQEQLDKYLIPGLRKAGFPEK